MRSCKEGKMVLLFCFVFWCAEYWIFFEEWKGVALNTNLPCKALNKIVDKGEKKPKEPLHYG